ncbi:hypothetical protein KP509_14G083300 [Ceratopteris richardii]|nr:hypothetical protein KP509_14G083300 [Ceratopteris richardii]
MDNSKLRKLGFEFKHDLADMYLSGVKCCVEKGLMTYPGESQDQSLTPNVASQNGAESDGLVGNHL